jgi:thiol-disulfide isomerase/thioredoxin
MKLLRFGAEWCAPCRAIGPILDKILGDYDGMDYVYIDVDEVENTDTVSLYSIRSIPTLVIVEDGEEKRRMTGSASEEIIRKFIEG